jgi:hypothetical protein
MGKSGELIRSAVKQRQESNFFSHKNINKKWMVPVQNGG